MNILIPKDPRDFTSQECQNAYLAGDTRFVRLNWAFNRKRGEEIRRHWDMIPNDTDVLITHGPPAGFLDQSKPGKSGHLGCDDLKEAIYRVEPELHLFGHIHGSGGMKKTYVGDTGHKTILANCAILDEQYLVKNKPMEIEI